MWYEFYQQTSWDRLIRQTSSVDNALPSRSLISHSAAYDPFTTFGCTGTLLSSRLMSQSLWSWWAQVNRRFILRLPTSTGITDVKKLNTLEF